MLPFNTSAFSNTLGAPDCATQRKALITPFKEEFDGKAEDVLQQIAVFNQHCEETGIIEDFNFIEEEHLPPSDIDMSNSKVHTACETHAGLYKTVRKLFKADPMSIVKPFLTLNDLKLKQRSLYIFELMAYQSVYSWVKKVSQNQELGNPRGKGERKMQWLLCVCQAMRQGLD
jgi:hypothetical protein